MKLGDAAHATKFVHLFRFKISTPSSSSSTSRFSTITSTTNCPKLKPYSGSREVLKTKTLQLPFLPRAFNFQSPLTATASYLRSFRLSGSGSILGLTVASASAATVAHAMDAGDAWVDYNSQDPSEEEENGNQLWNLTRKIWLPVLFFLTVLTNLENPLATLFIKLTLFLLSTKPNPFSVYIYVDQLCQQAMCQETQYFIVKTLYASKVEVQDYKLLCLASVEVGGQKFTLIGILGTWWSLPQLPSRETFSLVRIRHALASFLVKKTEQGRLLR